MHCQLRPMRRHRQTLGGMADPWRQESCPGMVIRLLRFLEPHLPASAIASACMATCSPMKLWMKK